MTDATPGAPPKRHVYLFHPRFWHHVETGKKLQTLRKGRPEPHRPHPGELVCPRKWGGTPYRSRQRDLIPPTPIVSVTDARVVLRPEVEVARVWLGGESLTHLEACAFVRADGFATMGEFVRYWLSKPDAALDWSGILVRWAPPRRHP